MAGVHPFDAGFAVEDGDAGAQFHSHTGFGPQEVDAGEEAVGLLELRQQGAQAVAESQQDALYLVTLVELQLTQVVAQLHHLGRFHEGGEAGGRLVLDETFDFAAVGGEQRDDGAAVADGHLGTFGSPSFALGTRQGAAYLRVDLGGLAGLGASYLGQGRGGVVVELAVVVDELAKQRVDDVEL